MDWKIGTIGHLKTGTRPWSGYLIAETAEHYCLLVDGRKSDYESPKKNYKHLQGTLINSGSMAQEMGPPGNNLFPTTDSGLPQSI